MEGQIVFFFFVMNFCTAIFTHEKEYFISNAWIYYQRVVSKKIEGNFGFGRNVVSFLATFLICGQFVGNLLLFKENFGLAF
jgi:hypothetical protein